MNTDRWAPISRLLHEWALSVLEPVYPKIVGRIEHEGVVDDCPQLVRVVYAGGIARSDGTGWQGVGCCPVWEERFRIEIVQCMPTPNQMGQRSPAEQDAVQDAVVALQEQASLLFGAFMGAVEDLRDPTDPNPVGDDGLPTLDQVTPIELYGGIAGYQLHVRYIRTL